MVDNRRVNWAPRARKDLLDIWRYFADVGSADVADGILRDIGRVSQRLGRHPFMGRPRDELVTGLRSVLAPPHIVFYRVSDDIVEIARVLHQRRDLAAALVTERDR